MKFDEEGRAILLTLGEIPLLLMEPLAYALTTALGSMGWRDVMLAPGMRIVARPPGPHDTDVLHLIRIKPAREHPGMVGWVCGCDDEGNMVYCDPGRAVNAALAHVPAGHRWCVQPDDRLITEATS